VKRGGNNRTIHISKEGGRNRVNREAFSYGIGFAMAFTHEIIRSHQGRFQKECSLQGSANMFLTSQSRLREKGGYETEQEKPVVDL